MRHVMTLLMVAALSTPGFLSIGCDDTVHQAETVQRKADGTVVTEKEKTTRAPDGSTETTTEKKVDRTDTDRNRNP